MIVHSLFPARCAEWYIASGCSGLFAVCQSSEMYFLSEEERLELAEYVATKVAVSCSSSSTALPETPRRWTA